MEIARQPFSFGADSTPRLINSSALYRKGYGIALVFPTKFRDQLVDRKLPRVLTSPASTQSDAKLDQIKTWSTVF